MAKKVEEKKEVVALTFNFSDSEIVTVIAVGKSKHLVEGQEYEVSGNVAKALITKGIAKVK